MNNFNYLQYLKKRFARIFPMYFIFTPLTFLNFLTDQNHNSKYNPILYFLNISFLWGVFENFKFTGVAQGWFLTVEEVFYLIAPLSFILILKSRKYLVALPVFIMSIGVALVYLCQNYNLYGFFRSYEFCLIIHFLVVALSFFIGITPALSFKKIQLHVSFRGFTWIGMIGIIISCSLLEVFKGFQEFGVRTPLGKLTNNIILPLLGVAPFFYGLIPVKTFFFKILSSRFSFYWEIVPTFFISYIGESLR